MPVRAVLFDAADTLFRVRGSVGTTYATIAARHGVHVTADEIERRFRSAFRRMPPLAFPGIPDTELAGRAYDWWSSVVAHTFDGYSFADFDAFFRELFEHFARAEAWELFPDTQATLATLRQRGLRLGIVSNFDSRLLSLCRGLGIAGVFDAVIMSGAVGYAKPDPRIFATALQALAVAANETIHVGDSESEDIAGARAAGLRAIHLRRATSVRHGADEIGDLSELLHLIA